MYTILKDIKRLMTKLIQNIASWLTGELITNLEKAVLMQSLTIQNREMLSVARGSPPSIPHLLSCLHRLNCTAASAFQECDSCPWPRLQINTTCPLLLSALGRISARQEREDKGKDRWGCFSSAHFEPGCLTSPIRLWAVGLRGAGRWVPSVSGVA